MGRKARRARREAEEIIIIRPKRLGGLMAPSEQVVVEATLARRSNGRKYLFTLGLFELWRRRQNLLVTDRHVLLGRGLVSRHERKIPLDRVEDVSLSRRGMSSYVALTVNDHGRERAELVGPFSAKVARRIASEIVGRT